MYENDGGFVLLLRASDRVEAAKGREPYLDGLIHEKINS